MRARVGKRWIVLGAAGVGLIGSALTLAVAPSKYAATGTLLASSDSTTLTDLEGQASVSAQAAQNYTELATTPTVLDPVVRALGLDETVAHLSSRMSAERPADTALVKVSVSDPDPQRAVRIDAAVLQELVRAAKSLKPGGDAGARLVILQTPSASTSESTRNVPFALLAGTGTGAGLGALLVLLPELRRRGPASGGLGDPSTA